MPQEVILPRVDMDMAEGKISRWFVDEGAAVTAGQPLFEIETDKAAMEIEAPATGVLRFIQAKAGERRSVGLPVAYIFAEGEAAIEPAATRASLQNPTSATSPALSSIPLAAAPSVNGIRATPLARRIARERGIDLHSVNGSGPRGRIVSSDIPQETRLAARVASHSALETPYEAGSFEAIAVTPIRATIARRLTESWTTIPHFMLQVHCAVDRLEEVRERLNSKAPKSASKEPLYKLSLNDFVVKAYALALQRLPDANVTWSGSHVLRHKTSDIGVAIAVPGGLFTPVVRSAETKSLSQISTEIRSFASRAKEGKLLPADYRGGTGAVSNLGMYGVEQFGAIINPPHATILAVGAASEHAVRGATGIRIQRSGCPCTLSCDHRAVDGALGAELLARFRAFVEDPALMLL
ncbi:MAG: 2-oxo acid dehydrogenase subunit E2 [Rhizobiales bacterium]|nr:2-oxo acid dehydrogenase subunit E2 [Hyphomicrobiales bacterium]